MKSSSRLGPRRPARSELWLSGSTTPWLVVSRFSRPWDEASSCFWRVLTASPTLDLREPSGRDDAMGYHSRKIVAGAGGAPEAWRVVADLRSAEIEIEQGLEA